MPQLVTIPGQATYHVDVADIVEVWVEYGGYRLPLQRPEFEYTEWPGMPFVFWYTGTTLRLWPTPDAAYTIGFVAREWSGVPGVGVYGGRWVGEQPNQQWEPLRAQTAVHDGGFVVTQKSEDEANAKSLKLLKQWLTSLQLEEYDRHGYFSVKGSEGGEYRITDRRCYNVDKIENGVVAYKLCFMPEGATGVGDMMLAQKITLETDESRALVIANHSPADNIDPWRGAVYDGLSLQAADYARCCWRTW